MGEVLEVIRDRRIAAREGDDLQDGGRLAMMFALDVVALEKKQINNNQPINKKKPKRGQAEASRVKDRKTVSDQK